MKDRRGFRQRLRRSFRLEFSRNCKDWERGFRKRRGLLDFIFYAFIYTPLFFSFYLFLFLIYLIIQYTKIMGLVLLVGLASLSFYLNWGKVWVIPSIIALVVFLGLVVYLAFRRKQSWRHTFGYNLLEALRKMDGRQRYYIDEREATFELMQTLREMGERSVEPEPRVGHYRADLRVRNCLIECKLGSTNLHGLKGQLLHYRDFCDWVYVVVFGSWSMQDIKEIESFMRKELGEKDSLIYLRHPRRSQRWRA